MTATRPNPNPADPLDKAPGPERETRAGVLAAKGSSEETPHQLRGAGYDLSTAPKSIREGLPMQTKPPKANPTGHKRPRAATAKKTTHQPGNMTKLKSAREAPAKAKTTAAKVAKKLCAIGPDKVQPLKSTARRINPSTAGKLAHAATRKALMSKKPQDHAKALELHMQAAREYAWQNKLGKTQAERDAAGALADEHVGISELHEALAGITPATHAPRVAKAKAKAKAKPLASKAKTLKWAKQAGLHVTSFNPTSAGDLARVWKAWTGTDPDQTISFDVEQPTVSLKAGGRVSIPEKVVILGRVSKFISKTGRLADFGAKGPLMVTDAKAERVWLLSDKPYHFDVEPSVIAYLARKPKFGDRDLVEYVHAFKGRVRAAMAGQIGAMTGGFRITPRGLED